MRSILLDYIIHDSVSGNKKFDSLSLTVATDIGYKLFKEFRKAPFSGLQSFLDNISGARLVTFMGSAPARTKDTAILKFNDGKYAFINTDHDADFHLDLLEAQLHQVMKDTYVFDDLVDLSQYLKANKRYLFMTKSELLAFFKPLEISMVRTDYLYLTTSMKEHFDAVPKSLNDFQQDEFISLANELGVPLDKVIEIAVYEIRFNYYNSAKKTKFRALFNAVKPLDDFNLRNISIALKVKLDVAYNLVTGTEYLLSECNEIAKLLDLDSTYVKAILMNPSTQIKNVSSNPLT